MLSIRWSRHTEVDIRRIAAFWQEQNPEKLSAVITTIRRRIGWIAGGREQSGTPIAELPRHYRWYLERTYGHKIYYRMEGDRPNLLSVIAIRHSRQRPLSPSTVRKYAK